MRQKQQEGLDMTHVFLHTHTPGKYDWDNRAWDFPQIPHVGEYVALASADAEWYQVEFVVHCAFKAEYEAEVYAVQKNHLEVMKVEVDSYS
jgi:hypothetical protein